MNKTHSFNVAMIGEYGVGKTSIVFRLMENRFYDPRSENTADEYKSKLFKIHPKNQTNPININLHLYDTASMEKGASMTSNYFRDKHGFVFVWDIDKPESYTQLQSWEEQIKCCSNARELAIVVFANKCDVITNTSPLVYNQCEAKYGSSRISCFKTSARTGDGVKEGFNELLLQLIINNSNQQTQLPENFLREPLDDSSNNPSFISNKQNCCLH